MSIRQLTIHLGKNQTAVAEILKKLHQDRVIPRIWQKDYTLWKPAPTEIVNRLGWLTSPRDMMAELPGIGECVAAVRAAGYTRAVLLGMGGSSLAPEVFRKSFGVREGYPDLVVLDSTDPETVLTLADALDPAKTLFIVATKSGGTVETFSFMKFFFQRLATALGPEEAGRHFIAITDPGSALADIATRFRFRHTFLNNPDIGGRYSALSCFGIVPAALIGIDVRRFLERAAAQAEAEAATSGPEGGSAGDLSGMEAMPDGRLCGAALGAVLGELAARGRDKATFFFSPQISSFGDWLEQLIAESTGKEGKGILPVVGESLGDSLVYGADRLFILLGFPDDPILRQQAVGLEAAGQPVIRLTLADPYDLGAQCFLWEMATAVAGWSLGINPFDQPDVESAKILARNMLTTFREEGRLPEEEATLADGNIRIYSNIHADTPTAALTAFLKNAGAGAYVALQAYLPTTPETDQALLTLRTAIRDRYHLAVTLGYGPRFLHSTGQIHKGDAGRGLFIQITADTLRDAPIPDELDQPGAAMTFGTLEKAQAAGDALALRKAGRRVIRFHFTRDVAPGLAALAATLRDAP